jgi:hypothetical protein
MIRATKKPNTIGEPDGLTLYILYNDSKELEERQEEETG